MSNILKGLVLSLGIMIGAGLFFSPSTYAADVIGAQCAADPGLSICKQDTSPTNLTKDIINTLLFVVGSISIVMIIIGGIMYATSAGDAGQVTKAKNTIMYAVVGLVVSILAFAIVQFVVSRFIP